MINSTNSTPLPWLKAIGKIPLLISLGLLVFLLTLGPGIASNREVTLDTAILKFLHQVIPASWDQVFILIYKVTGKEVTAILILGSLIFALSKRYWAEAKCLAFATLGILLVIDQGFKPFFNRLRPGTFDANLASLVDVDGKSFPSGHAGGSLVFYFYMAFVLSAHFPQYRQLIYLAATVWVGLVGLSSMYCRVHWPSDIVAGYSIGFVWLSLTLAWLRRSDPFYGPPSSPRA